MHRIFFTNKGHTKRAGMPNIYPYKPFSSTPIEVFSIPGGLTLIIDPKLVHRNYFTCEFYAIINESVVVIEYGENRRYYSYSVALGGNYNKYNGGVLNINNGHEISKMSPDGRRRFVGIQKEALDLIHEGISQFENYFMIKEEQPV